MMACVSPLNGELERSNQNKYNLKTAPANGIHHRDTPSAGFTIPPSQARGSPPLAKPKHSTISEENEEQDDDQFDKPYGEDNTLSAEAQAHNISMFLCTGTSSTSDSGGEEPVSETVITDVYKDPLEYCMEGIEETARRILRTGRLAISGEPGDMSKIQPALFNLQPAEKEMAQLIPQLIQVPFFHQGTQLSLMTENDDSATYNADEALANGNIRLSILVDTAIYALLRSHCAKGAQQAEEVINTAMSMRTTINITSANMHSSMPPIVTFNFRRNRDVTKHQLYVTSSSSLSETSTNGTSFSSLPRSEASDSNLAGTSRKSSGEECALHSPAGMAVSPPKGNQEGFPQRALSPTIGKVTSPSPEGFQQRRIDPIQEEPPQKPLHPPLMQSLSNPGGRVRRTSTVITPPPSGRTRVSSIDSNATGMDINFFPGKTEWNTSIVGNNTVMGQYGNKQYPEVWWDPAFKIDFRLSSSVGILSGTVIGIDPSRPEVTLRVFNNSPKQVGFSIRSHRQSTVFSSHVVYPKEGLHTLEPYKSWEDNVEFYPNAPGVLEMFVIDLFFCTLDSKPSWNIVRKYAIMKPLKSPNTLKRVSKRRPSFLQLPGTKDPKSDNLELVISHGLQCVVKGKLDEAEIIFSQVVYLPDFQRVAIKAFVYVCLAVIANKRRKEGGVLSRLMPIMTAVECSSRLVSICEHGPGSVKMPYTIQLVKQLKKELNVQKIMKDYKKVGRGVDTKSTPKTIEQKVEEFPDITVEGSILDFQDTQVTIPPHALSQTTTISLSQADHKHLIPMLKASGWERVVQVASVTHIECSPHNDHFNKPIKIATKLPNDLKPGPSSKLRLMHSNYLRHWEDITDDVCTKLWVEDDGISMETNLHGWLAVLLIQFDASLIAGAVLKSISMEPLMLRLNVFGYIDSERKSIQVLVYVVPCKGNEEPLHKEIEKPENYTPISFPHVVQAYPNEKLRLEIQGAFEPDTTNGEKDLTFEMEVQQKHNQLHTKWIRSTAVTPTSSSSSSSDSNLSLCGKLEVSSCRNNSDKWESLAHVSLSMRRNAAATSSGSSSNSDHS